MRLAVILAMAGQAAAHIAMFNEALFGLNYPYTGDSTEKNYNNNKIIAPLRKNGNYTVDEWFAHGYKNLTPAEGAYMWLPSGGNYIGELGCNRAYTSCRDPRLTTELEYYACPEIGTLHNANKYGETLNISLFGGTALAIAYTSDVDALTPADMTVISINYTSPWQRETIYPIPAGLPTCPSGGCLCTWNWIHQQNHGEGYGEEIYNTLYRCMVNGSTDDSNTVGTGGIPNYCANDASNCTTGPKQPMYLWQVDGNNMDGHLGPEYPTVNPTYNERFGWSDGAQDDAIVKGSGESSASAPSLSSTPAAAALLAATVAGLTSLSSIASTLAAATASASAMSDDGAADSTDGSDTATEAGEPSATDVLGSASATDSVRASRTGSWAHAHRSHRHSRSGMAWPTDLAGAGVTSSAGIAARATATDMGAGAVLTTTMPGGQVCMRVPRNRDEL